jgi:hypothetical protein
MKDRRLLYIPLLLLFALAVAVLIVHTRQVYYNYGHTAIDVQLPYKVDGTINALTPEGEAAGLRSATSS